jgi:hypothetical protein
MKYLVALLFSAVLFIGCGDKNETGKPAGEQNKYAYDSSDIKLEPVDNPAQEFAIVYKFEKNTPYNYRVSMISDMDQVAIAETTINMNVHQSMVYLLSFTPRETDNDGTTELSCTITSARIEMEGNGRTVLYQSDSVKTAEDKERFADHHAMINNPFSIRVSKSGDLLEIYKTDKIVAAFLEYRNLKDSATIDDRNSLKSQMSESAIKPLMTQIFKKMPENKVAKDSSWDMRQPRRQMLVFQVDQTNRFKINQLEKLKDDKVAVIGVQMITNIQGDSKHSEQGVDYNIQKPKITASGTIFFNIDEGFVQKVKSETVIETFLTAEAPTPQGKQKRSSKEIIKTSNIVEKI